MSDDFSYFHRARFAAKKAKPKSNAGRKPDKDKRKKICLKVKPGTIKIIDAMMNKEDRDLCSRGKIVDFLAEDAAPKTEE